MAVRNRNENQPIETEALIEERNTSDTPPSESDNEMLDIHPSVLTQNNWKKDQWNI
ncbi:unnamed protein product, partial [Adineta steineri]